MSMLVIYLTIDSKQYRLIRITQLEIKESINNHSQLLLTALIDDDDTLDSIYDTNAGSQLSLSKNIGKDKNLFKGMVKNISIEQMHGDYILKLTGISHTYLMDIEKKSRSFQNKEMKYSDLLKLIAAEYTGGDVINHVTGDKTIEPWIMQYQETDWEFVKRIASHFHEGVVPSILLHGSKFTVSLPEGDAIGKIENYNYYIEKDIERYMRLSQNGNNEIKELDATEFHIETGKELALGDKAVFKDISLYVKEKRIRMDRGALIFHYVLCQKKGVKVEQLYNSSIIGLSLKGKVLKVEQDIVMVHLEIDKEAPEIEKAHPFQYTTMYTAEGNAGWYCMPEIGDTVLIYFPTKEEQSAVGMNSIRELDRGSDKLKNPDIKYFRTANGKELKFSPEEIVITCCNGVDEETGEEHITYIRLNEKNGIEIISTEPVLLKSDENINLESGNEIFVAAKKEIIFKCKTSQITVNEMIDIAGREVRIN